MNIVKKKVSAKWILHCMGPLIFLQGNQNDFFSPRQLVYSCCFFQCIHWLNSACVWQPVCVKNAPPANSRRHCLIWPTLLDLLSGFWPSEPRRANWPLVVLSPTTRGQLWSSISDQPTTVWLKEHLPLDKNTLSQPVITVAKGNLMRVLASHWSACDSLSSRLSPSNSPSPSDCSWHLLLRWNRPERVRPNAALWLIGIMWTDSRVSAQHED